MDRHPKSAHSLAQAIKNCSPRPLTVENLADFWVETQSARDGLVSFRENLRDHLEREGTPKVLVYGHRGCGKSTEINKFLIGLDRNDWLVIKLNAGDFLPVSGNQAADVLLAACTRILEVAEQRKLALNEKSLAPVLAYFAETTKTNSSSREAAIEIEAGADASTSVLGKLFGLRAKLVSALKFGSRSETSEIQQVRRRKGELATAVHALATSAQLAWQKEIGRASGRLLLVIEDLDKLGLEDARRIFVEDGRLLAEVGIAAIYTIPIFAYHSADAGAIRAYFEHEQGLPMIKVRTPSGDAAEEGRQAIREIVRKRVAAEILPDDALELLIDRTGGVLRDVFEAIQTAAQFLPAKKSGVLSREMVQQALKRMETTIGLQIAYPPNKDGEQKSPQPLQEKLAALARKEAHNKIAKAEPDPELQLLLMSGALLEYNGVGWLGVHPLARAYLADLGYEVDGGDDDQLD